MYVLFNFIVGLDLIFLCFILIIIQCAIPYPKTKENKILMNDKIEPQHTGVLP